MSENGYGNQGQPPIPPSNYPYANQQPQDQGRPNGGAQQAGYAYTQPPHSNPGPASAPAKPPKQKQKKSGFGKTFLAGFLGAALACAVAGGGFAAYSSSHNSGATSSTTVLGSTTSTPVTSNDNEDRAEAVADKVLPSVVGIDVYSSSSNGSSWGQLFDNGGDDNLTYTGLGSGVIISTDGYILTNYHVIEGADKLEVTANGDEYDAQVVGTDESSDLAVLKIDADNLTAIEIGDSDNLVPGQWVMTAGSPFGLEQSVATGVVSATSRTVTVQNSTEGNSYYYGGQSSGEVSIYSNMIQTDAAINPGNSGGALVDANGQLIGINAVIESYSGSYSGVGFAIPVNYAINIAQQIIDGKTPTHAQLGVSATTINSDISKRFNLDADEGAYVSAVYEGSAASDAGLQPGDIITAVDDTDISSSTDLVAACRSHQVGDKVTITFVRDGQTQTVDVTLGSDEDDLKQASTQQGSLQQQNQGGSMGNPFGSGSSYGTDSSEGDLKAAA